ncbi:hypothetical protein SAZ10_00540 [Mesorhizobium sp. BAC0120]|uniref:hypothetical protein n=1 Tax=Mesorhizobium sp. BAC0120 TaxID=3090670 RepID=UPI00298CD53D|nr:hypothetical protein [Mesorhizobium sp. BAC0120]MDW6020243.1 hypothetical protein [Mesorhizobium sp. BAC0120]
MEKRRTGRPSGRPSQDAVSTVRAAETDMWMYSVAGPRLFKLGEEIPAEYEDSPAKVRE